MWNKSYKTHFTNTYLFAACSASSCQQKVLNFENSKTARDTHSSECKECGGASICLHQRQRSKCKDCHEEADESMPAGLEELEGTSSKVARSAGERGPGAVGAAFGAAGESAPLVMEIEPVSGCTGPAPVGGRVKRKPNIIDRGASAASASDP